MHTVLLVDDTRLALAIETSWLRERHLTVIGEQSPILALRRARECCPDLVVADYEMPELTGAELCSLLKADFGTAHIPVLISSSHNVEPVIRRCMEAGAAGFIHKSGGRQELLNGIAKALGIPYRRHMRMACRVTVGLVCDGGQPVAASIRDVSESGMFVEVDAPWPITMPLRFSFMLPSANAPLISGLGEVVREQELDSGKYGYGVQFLEMATECQIQLREFILSSI